MRYPIILHPSRDGGYTVEFPDFPVCMSAGATVQEAVHNAAAAVSRHIAERFAASQAGSSVRMPELSVPDGGIVTFVSILDATP